MAEIPDLGKHCALKGCNQLDFMPFHCDHCTKFYCRNHRLPDQHGCPVVINSQQIQNADQNGADKEEEFKFLCSMKGCFIRERTRLQCPRCQKCFCMRHRICEDHACPGIEKEKIEEKPRVQLPMVEKKTNKTLADSTKPSKEKKLSAEQQKRLDRTSILRLKARNPLNLPADQQWFLFANLAEADTDNQQNQPNSSQNNGRHLVVVSRQWSLLRALWYICEQLGLSGHSEEFDAFPQPSIDQDNEEKIAPLSLKEPVSKLLANEADFLLVRRRKADDEQPVTLTKEP